MQIFRIESLDDRLMSYLEVTGDKARDEKNISRLIHRMLSSDVVEVYDEILSLEIRDSAHSAMLKTAEVRVQGRYLADDEDETPVDDDVYSVWFSITTLNVEKAW
jgi:hypothetical protein